MKSFPANSASSFSRLMIGVLAGAFVLILVALYNGFPLVFADSGTYIKTAIDAWNSKWLSTSWSRPPFYSLFIFPLHMTVSLWPVVIVQSLVVAHLLYLVQRELLGQVPLASYLILVSLLLVFSSVPWFVGQVTPDIFLGVVVLSLYLVGFHLERLGRLETVYLIALSAAGISFHFSHIPVAFGLVGMAALLLLPLGLGSREYLRRVSLMLLPAMLAVLALIGVHSVSKGDAEVAPSGYLFLLARSLEDGPALRYLEAHCETESFALCDHLDQLGGHPATFLWAGDSPLYSIGVKETGAEAKRIMQGVLREYPAWSAWFAVKATLSQLLTFDTASWFAVYVNDPAASINRVLREHFERSYPAYVSSRQSHGELPQAPVQWLHRVAVGMAAIAVLLMLVQAVRYKRWVSLAFAVFVCSALVFNAFVCGALSLVTDRYQSRVVWLLVLCAVLFIFHHREGAGTGDAGDRTGPRGRR